MYNTNKIAITINGVGMELLGSDSPSISASGAYAEPKIGINGAAHYVAKNGVYHILTLPLRYDSPNIAQLENLAENHVEFSASYKDISTGKVYNTIKGAVVEVGVQKADDDRKFTIHFL